MHVTCGRDSANYTEYAISSIHSHTHQQRKITKYTSLVGVLLWFDTNSEIMQSIYELKAKKRRRRQAWDDVDHFNGFAAHMSKLRYSGKSVRFNFVHIEKYRKILMSEENIV